MSVRNGFVLLLTLSALLFVGACGSSNHITNPVAPPSGSFSNSSLNGTYVFSASGLDINSAPYAIVGTLNANGSGGVTGGTFDINDADFSAPGPNNTIGGSSSYNISVDGRGEAKLSTSTPFGTITLDFVLQDSSHGLVIELDGNATGSGSLDSQTAGVTPTGSYAFSFSGADATSGTAEPFVAVGNFAIGSGGLEDFNDAGFAYPDQTLAASVVLGPSATPATTLTTTQFGTQTYDVYAIDSTHLKFIEMDSPLVTLSGDAYSQTSTTMPVGTLAFTLAGSYPTASSVAAAGGFMVTDNANNIDNTSSADTNNGGNVSPSPQAFSGTYTAAGTGRYTLALTGFADGSSYAAYPYSGGVLLLEIDSTGILAGAAYPQTSTTFATSQGYGLNLSGFNISASSEVDEIAEFSADSSGTTVTGLIDENSLVQSTFDSPLSGTYVAPDSNGRGGISASAGTSSTSTLNGGFALTFYTVDGTTFPFIESDSGQVAAGVFVQQSPTSSSAAIARAHNMFIAHPLIRPHALKHKQIQK